jgi:hypothetical protein
LSASSISPAVAHRASRSRSSARITTSSSLVGISARWVDGRGMSPRSTASSVASESLRANSRCPASISQHSTPAENRSVRGDSASRRTCSGDMYGNEPVGADCFASASSGSPSVSAMPKSTSLTSPSRDSMTLRGDRSRWITPSPLRWA